MRLSVKRDETLEEPSVLVEYAEADREFEAILAALNGVGAGLVGRTAVGAKQRLALYRQPRLVVTCRSRHNFYDLP